jgi:hypothetical protein
MNADLNFDGGFTSESWEYATAFAMSLGTLPTSVTSVVRLLLSDYEKNPTTISDYGRFFMSRFLKSKTLQAVYYHVCKHLRPESLPDPSEPLQGDELLRAFSGEEHAYLLSFVFFHRQAKKYCDAALFENATSRLQRGLNLGGMIGKLLPAVGLGTGLLCGGFRYIAFFAFIRHDPDGFLKYTRHLRSKEIASDWAFEFERWQCNSLQIAIMILQRAGLGADRLSQLMKAVGTRSPILPDDPFERACRSADIWYQCLSKKRKRPAIPLPPEFYLGHEELQSIFASLAEMEGSKVATWLVREKSDLTPEATPQLFLKHEHLPSRDALAPEQPQDIPPDLEGALPNEAIDSLSKKLLQDILKVAAD